MRIGIDLLSPEERTARWHAQKNWHAWYAWHPVTIPHVGIVWL
jgi:hypothetical protein